MLKGIHHIGWCVKDFEQSKRFFVDSLGMSVKDVHTWGTPPNEIMFFDIGGTYVEMFRPCDESSSVNSYLKEHGEGINHMAFEVANLEATATGLKAQGMKFQREGAVWRGFNWRLAALDPASAMGTSVQLVEPIWELPSKILREQRSLSALLKGIHHIGWCVKDFEQSKRFFVDSLGISVKDVHTWGTPPSAEVMFFDIGGTYVEIIRPCDESSFVNSYLKEHGEGINHIAFEVENLGAAVTGLKAQGVKFQGEEAVVRGFNWRLVALDPASTMGISVQLVEPIWELPSKILREK